MIQIRKILCPIDFSDTAREALHYAVGLAGILGAELALLHVYQAPGVPMPEGMVMAGPEEMAAVTASVETSLNEWRAEAAAMGATAITTATAIGSTQSEIVRVATEAHVDLIVMGTHGRTGLSHALLGSTAERVVRHATCPVLTVRQRPL